MFGEAATKCRNSAIGGNLAAIESGTLQRKEDVFLARI